MPGSSAVPDLLPAPAAGLSAAPGEWRAALTLRLERRAHRTVLAHSHHHGPLRIQKPLYPESPGRAELLILHPPSGIAGGDRLELDIELAAGAQARITNPGATRWYGGRERPAHLNTRLRVGADAVLEWLPQESIVYDGARAQASTQIACADTARACGWDLWMLGRRAAGETFSRGSLRGGTRLMRGDRLLWMERTALDADDGLRTSALGWHGAGVMGSFWALGLPDDPDLLQRCRDIVEPGVRLGVGRFDHGLWLARALSDSAERLRTALTRVWMTVRPALCGDAGLPPRIWAT